MLRAVFDALAAMDDFRHAQLGHKTRPLRLAATAGLLAEEAAGRSLPDRLPRRADYDAALNLVNLPGVTHHALLLPHSQATRQRMLARPGVVLNISDTTDLDFSGLKIACLGPIGNGLNRGFECHNSLALDPATGDVLGLTSQILHVRENDFQIEAERCAHAAAAEATDPAKPKPKKKKAGRRSDETAEHRRQRLSRESRLWVKGCEALGAVPEGKLWVDVCDRAADTFEYLEFMAKRSRHYTIRSAQNRALVVVEGQEQEPTLLHDRLRSVPGVMSWQVEIAANHGQVARTATVEMAWRPVRIKAPREHKGEHGDEPVDVWAIRVWEPQPPVGVKEPLEWLLLTNVVVHNDAEARERVGWYERRAVVEEFHKAQKTGMGIETLQLQSRHGLEGMIAILSVLAVALLNLRQMGRQEEAARQPAATVVDPQWVAVLSIWTYGERRELSVRQFYLDLARLGGYRNRRRGAWPGWLVLWRGLTKLLHMVQYESSRANSPDLSRTSPEL
jgi:hypothetical protein